MQAYLLVGLGGALGAAARYGISSLIGRAWSTGFPLATLVVNIAGSFFMGVLIGLLARTMPQMAYEIRLFVAVGLLGGFTTFSSFSLDTIVLIERGELAQALFYIGMSVVICLAGLYLGLLITRGAA
ncbi:MAG: fluoride efflux transporter CrcB [Devosia sp.]|uniref:fluoride efflux transporter CrcB n=1 Tax=Devosia sp. TaxID=1871048 RepID=UPI0024CAE82C|nr:fluoride efflux transporter CrcB [Devosia sp.]UYO00469.1 MAG: fluoride efflux transporter CrcB [Devosia sp.]